MNSGGEGDGASPRSSVCVDELYIVEWFDYRRVTAEETKQISYVYEVAFRDDIGLIFDPQLDADFMRPLEYYSTEVNGAFLVTRRRSDGVIVGTCALRPIITESTTQKTVELKRMFLLPEARGRGISHTVMPMIISKAKELQYGRIILDTKFKLIAANKVYAKYGFVDCERYNDNPRPDRFMALTL